MDRIEVETTRRLYAIISSPTKGVDSLYFLIRKKRCNPNNWDKNISGYMLLTLKIESYCFSLILTPEKIDHQSSLYRLSW